MNDDLDKMSREDLILAARRAREAEAELRETAARHTLARIEDTGRLIEQRDKAEAEVERLRAALVGIIQSADTIQDADDIARAALQATEPKRGAQTVEAKP